MRFGSVPFLSSRMYGDVAWITWIYVPREIRRRGIGRAMVEAWRRKLPTSTREVRLLACEIDGESPLGFWERMGFLPEEEFPWVDEVSGRVLCLPLGRDSNVS